MTGFIFINYRRGDDPGHTGRLYDRLIEAYGSDRLFIDVDNIAPGSDFVKAIMGHVVRCDVMLVVIGRNWLRHEQGKRRLDLPNDYVRLEIEAGLSLGKRVIPVLVNGASMPEAGELPASLSQLALHHAVRLTHERFRADAQGLIDAIDSFLEDNRQAGLKVIIAPGSTSSTKNSRLGEAILRQPTASKSPSVPAANELKGTQKRESEKSTKLEPVAPVGTEPASAMPPAQSQLRATVNDAQLFEPTASSPSRRAILTLVGAGTAIIIPTGYYLRQSQKTEAPVVVSSSTATVPIKPAGSTGPAATPTSLKPVQARLLRELIGHRDAVFGVAGISDPAKVVSAGGDGLVLLWNAAEGRQELRIPAPNSGIWSLKSARSADLIAFGALSGETIIADAATGRSIARMPHGARVIAVAISDDGALFCTAGTDQKTWVWDVAGSRRLRQFTHQRDVISLAFARGSQKIGSGGKDGSVQVWTAREGGPIQVLEGHTKQVFGLAFVDGDDELVSCGEDGTVRLWSISTRKQAALIHSSSQSVLCVDVSQDQKLIAAGMNGGSIILWDRTSLTEITRWAAHDGLTRAIAFSRDGDFLFSGGLDRKVKYWALRS